MEAEPAHPVTEADEGTPGWEAYAVPCPECAQPEGFRCVYLTEKLEFNKWGYRLNSLNPRFWNKGEPTIRPHQNRMNALRHQEYLEDARREKQAWKAAYGPIPGPSRVQRQAHDALLEFDRREYEAIRDWLREHGEILWHDQRPDGTFRGDTYLDAAGLRLKARKEEMVRETAACVPVVSPAEQVRRLLEEAQE